jgi:hypothetical protein
MSCGELGPTCVALAGNYRLIPSAPLRSLREARRIAGRALKSGSR